MYAEFFGLRELPFSNTPDPRFFFSTPDHEEALASLIYAVQERKGFVLLTGEVGAGKTLLSRMMLKHFGTGISFAGIHHAIQGAGDLLEALCCEFELKIDPDASHNRLVRTLHDFLLAEFSKDTPVVLLLDEAQALTVDAFEQLRMMGNLEADDAKLLQIVILGQPELQRRFASREFRQLSQRIFRTFHLPALTRELTEAYIRHRLTIAGAPHTDIFDRPAVDRIYQHSKGLPRLINTICDNALLSAYSADCRRLDDAFIESTVGHMMSLGDGDAHLWNDRVSAPPTAMPASASPTEMTFRGAGEPSPDSRMGTLIQTLSRRMTDLESRLSDARAMATAVAPTGGSATSGESIETNDATRALTAQARRAGKQLETLLRQTSDVACTMKAERDRNKAEGARMARMAAASRTIVSEVRRVFDGLKRAAAKAQLAERRAEKICDRLEESGRNAIAATAAKNSAGVSCGVPQRPTSREATLLTQNSKPRDAVTPGTAGAPVRSATPAMLEALHESQSSVAELQTLVRTKKDERIVDAAVEKQFSGDGESESILRPTVRLAGQVDALLEIISAGNA